MRNARSDLLATNRMGRALDAPVFDSTAYDRIAQPANAARFAFLDARATGFCGDGDRTGQRSGGRAPCGGGRNHRAGVKQLHHPVVGDLELTCEAGQRMV